MIVDEALRNTDRARDADAVQIQRNAGEDGIRAKAETGAGWADCADWQHESGVSRVIKLGVEILHAVICFISVRDAVPTQAQVQGQPAVHAPVLLAIESPGNVVPLAAVLHRQLLIRVWQAEQHAGEAVSASGVGRASCGPGSKRVIEAETTLRLTEQVLGLLVKRPAPAEFELVGPMRPRDVVADLVVIRLVVPRPAGDFKLRTAATAQVDVGNAVHVVRPREDPGARAVVAG